MPHGGRLLLVYPRSFDKTHTVFRKCQAGPVLTEAVVHTVLNPSQLHPLCFAQYFLNWSTSSVTTPGRFLRIALGSSRARDSSN
jgi:hypothetical protein